MIKYSILAAVGSMALASSLPAALVNYMPFDGTAGTGANDYTTNYSGDSEMVFASQNDNLSTYQFANSSPMSYGALPTTSSYVVGGGGYERSSVQFATGNGSWWADNGNVSTPFTNADVDRGSLYGSVLLRDDQSDSETMNFILGNGGSSFNGLGSSSSALFGITATSGNAFTVHYKTGDSTLDTQNLSDTMEVGETNFFVFNVEFGDGTGDITYNLWLNPALGTAGPADFTQTVSWSSFTTNDNSTVGINTAYFKPSNANNDGSMDELRFGTTYSDVAPVPEPSTVAFFLAAAAGFMAFIRRRR